MTILNQRLGDWGYEVYILAFRAVCIDIVV